MVEAPMPEAGLESGAAGAAETIRLHDGTANSGGKVNLDLTL
jgi:hypothetical protein